MRQDGMRSGSESNDEVQALLDRAWWLIYLDGRQAGELGRRIVRLTDARPEHLARGYGWFHSAYALLRIGQLDEGGRQADQARLQFERLGDQRGLLLCDECDALRLHNAQQPQAAMRIHERVQACTGVAREPIDLYISHNLRGISRKLLGQTDDTLLDLYKAYEVALEIESPGPRINAMANLGGFHADLFNFIDARNLLEQALEASREAGAWSVFGITGINLVQTYDGLGLDADCLRIAELLLAHEAHLPPGQVDSVSTSMALAFLKGGDLQRCEQWLDDGIHATVGDGDGGTEWARVRAELDMARGHFAAARDVTERRLRECPSRQCKDQPYPFMKLLEAAATACERLGDTGSALAYMRQAHSLYETLVGRSAKARLLALQAAHDLARARRDRDRAEEARLAAERDRQRLTALNSALQQKIEEAEALQRQLREQALRDPLTGLHNRRFLHEAAPGQIELCRRSGEPLAVVMIDIDHFKRLNDSAGHEAGDLVLRRLAAMLTAGLRQADIVCRHGGEEFVLVMSRATPTDAKAVVLRLLQEFRDAAVEAPHGPLRGCTFSAGVASFPGDGDDLTTLLNLADERLYAAKGQGRARVCLAARDELPEAISPSCPRAA
jgi:diguanylate cyclase (GGDEF)-like protein